MKLQTSRSHILACCSLTKFPTQFKSFFLPLVFDVSAIIFSIHTRKFETDAACYCLTPSRKGSAVWRTDPEEKKEGKMKGLAWNSNVHSVVLRGECALWIQLNCDYLIWRIFFESSWKLRIVTYFADWKALPATYMARKEQLAKTKKRSFSQLLKMVHFVISLLKG